MKTILAASMMAAALVGAQPARAQSVGYVNVDLILRSGPDIYYPPVATLPMGSEVTVFGCIDGYLWCDVAWGYSRGWVAGQYVSIAYGPQRYPLSYYGPRYGLPIVSFVFGNYWDNYYRDRPWYEQRGRWQSWDYRRKRWDSSYDPKKWEDPKRGSYDPKRGSYDPKRFDDPKRGSYDPKRGNYDPKKFDDPKRGTYDPKKFEDPKRGTYDPKKAGDPKKFDEPKRGSYDPKKAGDPKRPPDDKKGDPGKKDDDKGK